MYIIIYNN